MREAPFELGVGAAQGGFGIDFEMAGQVDGREQEIANFAGQGLRRAMAISASTSAISSPNFARTARTSFQSNPTLPAFSCNFVARESAGNARGTPPSAPDAASAGGPGSHALKPRALLVGLDAPPERLHCA